MIKKGVFIYFTDTDRQCKKERKKSTTTTTTQRSKIRATKLFGQQLSSSVTPQRMSINDNSSIGHFQLATTDSLILLDIDILFVVGFVFGKSIHLHDFDNGPFAKNVVNNLIHSETLKFVRPVSVRSVFDSNSLDGSLDKGFWSWNEKGRLLDLGKFSRH